MYISCVIYTCIFLHNVEISILIFIVEVIVVFKSMPPRAIHNRGLRRVVFLAHGEKIRIARTFRMSAGTPTPSATF